MYTAMETSMLSSGSEAKSKDGPDDSGAEVKGGSMIPSVLQP